jgi:hypothetical protein
MTIIENKRNNNLESLFDLNFFENDLSEDWRFRPIWRALKNLKILKHIAIMKWLDRTFVTTLFEFASNVHSTWICFKCAFYLNLFQMCTMLKFVINMHLFITKQTFYCFDNWFIDLLGSFCWNLL